MNASTQIRRAAVTLIDRGMYLDRDSYQPDGDAEISYDRLNPPEGVIPDDALLTFARDDGGDGAWYAVTPGYDPLPLGRDMDEALGGYAQEVLTEVARLLADAMLRRTAPI